MKKIKRYLSGLILTVSILTLSQTTASAICCIRAFDGPCLATPASCADFAALYIVPGMGLCTDCSLDNTNPNTDYVHSGPNGEGWIVKNRQKVGILSDVFVAFLTDLNKKYKGLDMKDKKIQQQAKAEIETFEKTKEDHKVSAKTLEQISKETGLKIKYEK